ncbi:hypothetical protein [Streptomyces syringium]|uniref:hypothetical protein n=1 Tax=Streptomyces syringium TaxID=76729 RepID=UPI003AAD62B1
MRALRWHGPHHVEIADDTAQPRTAAPRDGVREPPMSLVPEGRIDPTFVVSHRLPLSEAPEGFRLSDAGEAVKAVLTP